MSRMVYIVLIIYYVHWCGYDITYIFYFTGSAYSHIYLCIIFYGAVWLFCSKVEEFGNIKTRFVISAPDSREGHEEVDESENSKLFVKNAWDKLIRQYGSEEDYLDGRVHETTKFLKAFQLEIILMKPKPK